MKHLSNLVGACLTAALLAACGGGNGTPLSPSPAGLTAKQTHVRPAYAVLYNFKGGTGDGALPVAGLLNVKGTLYGTTYRSGANGYGTVFAVTTAGKENLLHSFKGGKDGSNPVGVINVKGTLYGTTQNGGGANGDGTVFAITTSGREAVIHRFGRSGDGAHPEAGLINVKGTLYGTTANAGANDQGTVFSITSSGMETVLHSFGGSADGTEPLANLINVNGILYGTTLGGGTNDQGTVFAITTSGMETVLWSFGGSGDGANPEADLINVDGTLYGTTYHGGIKCPRRYGCGTVFALTTSGTETVLHRFGDSDGAHPVAGLISVNGTLYGTTEYGGANNVGTVFAITPSGMETVLHSFMGGSGDGENPGAPLLDVRNTLYGTTEFGGENDSGTVFSLSP